MDDFTREPMLDMFIFETLQLSDQLEQLVLVSEKANTFRSSDINEIFRIMHTIKGSASMMFFNNIAAVAHSMEDLFYYLRESDSSVMNYSKLCDLVLNGIDFIKREIAKIEANLPADGAPEDLLADIHNYLVAIKQPSENSEPTGAVLSEVKPAASNLICPSSDINLGNRRFESVVYFEEGCEMENIRAFNVMHKIAEIAHVIETIPSDVENFDCVDVIRQDGFKMYFTSDHGQEELMECVENLEYAKG